MHQRLNISRNSSANFTADITIPSCIPLDLMTLQPINSIKKFPQTTSTPRLYKMALLLSQMMMKSNSQLPASSTVSFELPSIGKSKPNQPLQPIQQTPRSKPSTWRPKCSNGPNPSFKNLGFRLSDDSTPIYKDSQPKIDITKENHLTIWFKHISVPIHYVHDQYTLLTIDPF